MGVNKNQSGEPLVGTDVPKVKVLSHNDNVLVLRFEGITPAFINSIRRALISEVPTLAIDEVVFYNNDSVLWDEVLAHRLALIPLKIGEETYDALRDCYENQGNDCNVIFSLDEEAVERIKTVYSGHLRFEGIEGSVLSGENFDIEPLSKKIPIVKLGRGQKLKLTAIARMGVGKDHAKWQPVSVAAYKFKPVIRIRRQPDEKTAEEIIKVCPRSVFGFSNGKLVVINENSCTLCRECQDKFPEYVSVSWDNSVAVFKVEGLGILPIQKIFEVAIDVLEKKVKIFVSLIEEKTK